MEGYVRGNSRKHAVPGSVGGDAADNQGGRTREPGKGRFQHSLGIGRKGAAAGHGKDKGVSREGELSKAACRVSGQKWDKIAKNDILS